MDTIAMDPLGDRDTPLHNPNHEQSPAMWAEGLWCASTLSPDIYVRVDWDGLINRAYDNADPEPSGHWVAAS